ncbi:hypothetical protein BBJ28_00026792, partial [Nothophytophthora sp. Chile5]
DKARLYSAVNTLAIKQKEECLELLGKELPEREREVVALAKKVELTAEGTEDADGVNVVASLTLLMGETFEAVGNRENATQMLSAQEEKQLVASLDFSADEMQLLYQTHVGKVDVYPKKATAWYTVGYYYLLIEKYDAAQRYFQYVVATNRKEQSAATSEMSG